MERGQVPQNDPSDDVAAIERAVRQLEVARHEVRRVVIGQDDVVDQLFVSVLSGGHVLLEGAPGLGKTMLVRTIASVLGLRSSRIQFTPDLMPGDITGTLVLVYDDAGRATSRFAEGPVFAELVLADEINRATPKTQSALLEAMQEQTVTVAGTMYRLPRPFLVLATQNPIEMEGTYILPEAQVDRFFFKVVVPYPTQAVLTDILDSTTGSNVEALQRVMGPSDVLEAQALVRGVPVPRRLLEGISRFAVATQPHLVTSSAEIRRSLRIGVSPRGAQTLVLAAKAHALMSGRYAVTQQDVVSVAAPALRHRVQPSFEAEADGVDLEQLTLETLRSCLA